MALRNAMPSQKKQDSVTQYNLLKEKEQELQCKTTNLLKSEPFAELSSSRRRRAIGKIHKFYERLDPHLHG